MINESKGQISVELVLLIGLILVITLAIVQYLGPSLEQDKVMSVSKMGFIDASNDLAYNGTGNTIRLNSLTFSNGVITAKYYSRKDLNSNDISYIKNKMLGNIAQALNTSISGNTVQGRYTYTINMTKVT